MSNTNSQPPSSLSDISGGMGESNSTQQYQAVPDITYEVKQEVDKSQPDYAMLFISIAVVTFLFLLFKPCRDFAVWVIKDILIPSLVWFFQIGSLWAVWLFKNVVTSHIDFAKHLMTPRNIIFFNLDDQRAENDKSINRKVEFKRKKK